MDIGLVLPGTAGEECIGVGVGLFIPGGSLKFEGKPPGAPGPAPGVGGPRGLRFGNGVAGPDLASEKAFMRAAMSGFMVGGLPLANVAAAGLRAASSWPREVDEAVMPAIVGGTLLSEAILCIGGDV